MRIMAVDPGEKNIGLAVSDPQGRLARPLTVLKHVSRSQDAVEIARLAEEHDIVEIIVGQALDEDGQPTFEGRRSARLAAAIRQEVSIPVRLWDESGSTQAAQQIQRQLGVSRSKRGGHLDQHAAAVILQDYLDSLLQPPDQSTPGVGDQK